MFGKTFQRYSSNSSAERYWTDPSEQRYSANPSAQADKKQRFGLIILGNSGAGKSFLANLFLQNEKFVHKSKATSVTKYIDFEECTIGDRNFVVFDIPGLIEANQAQIDMNKREIDKAFKECPNAVVTYVFGSNNGRIRNEDVVAFNALNDAYLFKVDSLVLVVNCIPAPNQRDEDYEPETIELLDDLLNANKYKSICFLDRINTNSYFEKQKLRDKLLPALTNSLPNFHFKKQDIHVQADELRDLIELCHEIIRYYEQERQRLREEACIAHMQRQKEMREQQKRNDALRRQLQEEQGMEYDDDNHYTAYHWNNYDNDNSYEAQRNNDDDDNNNDEAEHDIADVMKNLCRQS